jgi:hypothetical protein
VSKQKAIQIDSDGSDNKKVFYVSLLGSDDKGKPKKWRYVFDIITKKYDFFQTNVQAKDVRDLCDHYQQTTNNDSSNKNVYELCLHFIKDHKNSHFILDEVPILTNYSKYMH